MKTKLSITNDDSQIHQNNSSASLQDEALISSATFCLGKESSLTFQPFFSLPCSFLKKIVWRHSLCWSAPFGNPGSTTNLVNYIVLQNSTAPQPTFPGGSKISLVGVQSQRLSEDWRWEWWNLHSEHRRSVPRHLHWYRTWTYHTRIWVLLVSD